MSANGKFRMGLNVRKSVGAADEPKRVANVFGDESDDDEGQQNAAEKFERKYAASAGTKAREQRMVEKEKAENPDIFDYDAHYEQIQKQRDQKVAAQKEADKKKEPKYAHALAKAYKQRELSRLLVEENTYKKEREKEAGQFKDEEVFVTGAYRQQIEERERHKADMEREEALEKMRDVRDQKMWRQAFNRTLLENIARDPSMEAGKNEEEEASGGEKEVKKEKEAEMEGKEEEPKVKLEETNEEEQRGGNAKRLEGREKEDDKMLNKREETDERGPKRQQRPHPTAPSSSASEARSATKGQHRRRERTTEEGEGSNGRERGGETETDGRKRARRGKEEEQQKQDERQRMARIRQVLARRNDQGAIEEMKQRYLERRRGGQIRAPRIEAE